MYNAVYIGYCTIFNFDSIITGYEHSQAASPTSTLVFHTYKLQGPLETV